MTSSADSLLQIGSKHVTKGLGRLTEAIIVKGEGSYVTLHDGRKMLDFTCGIGVTNLGQLYFSNDCHRISIQFVRQGHCHPRVSRAAAEQCMSLVHGQVRLLYRSDFLRMSLLTRCLKVSIAYHAPYLQLIEKLLPVMPDPSLDSFFFWNSGSEAVEASIKMARLFTGRQNVIVMQGR